MTATVRCFDGSETARIYQIPVPEFLRTRPFDALCSPLYHLPSLVAPCNPPFQIGAERLMLGRTR